jgi:hypothetical protein
MMNLYVTCMQVQLVLALCSGPLKEDHTVRQKYQGRLHPVDMRECCMGD